MGIHYTPIGRIGDNSSRVDKTRIYNDTTLRPVQRGHFNAILHRVCPEHCSPQVVDGNTLWAIQICYEVTLCTSVTLYYLNTLLLHKCMKMKEKQQREA